MQLPRLSISRSDRQMDTPSTRTHEQTSKCWTSSGSCALPTVSAGRRVLYVLYHSVKGGRERVSFHCPSTAMTAGWPLREESTASIISPCAWQPDALVLLSLVRDRECPPSTSRSEQVTLVPSKAPLHDNKQLFALLCLRSFLGLFLFPLLSFHFSPLSLVLQVWGS